MSGTTEELWRAAVEAMLVEIDAYPENYAPKLALASLLNAPGVTPEMAAPYIDRLTGSGGAA